MAIQTFIFFDLETTGLINGKIMPKITEMALVAVARKSICSSNSNSISRVLHKLVLPIHPQKIIPPRVVYKTNLSNDDIKLLQPFNCDIYELIRHFLERLTPPICFAAHNGNNFDYPVFLYELESINKVLDSEILSIDTYRMFQDFFRMKKTNTVLHLPHPGVIEKDLFDDGYNELLSAVEDRMIEKETENVQNTATVCIPQISFCEDKHIKILDNKHNANKKCSVVSNQSSNCMQETNEKTPVSQRIKKQEIFVGRPSKKTNNHRRRLDFSSERPVNFRLDSIHEYMFGSNFECSHSAEADCLAMIRCVTQVADFFLEWSDNHALPLVRYRKT